MTQRKPILATANMAYAKDAAGIQVYGEVTDGPKEALNRNVVLAFGPPEIGSMLGFLAECYPDALLAVAGAISACDDAHDARVPGYSRDGRLSQVKRSFAVRMAATRSLVNTRDQEDITPGRRNPVARVPQEEVSG